MKTEPTLIPPADAAPTTGLASLERALAKCQDEAAEAFAASKGPPQLDEDGFEQVGGPGAQFGRAMALMKMTTKLVDAMAKLNSHRSQTHYVHRTEIRAVQSPPAPAPVAPPQNDDPPPRLRFTDNNGQPRKLTPAEEALYDAWAERESARLQAARLASYAEEGTPSPNSSGSNDENAPRVRLP